VFSFRDGVYLAKSDTFLPFSGPPVDERLVACKYFDLDFGQDAEEEDWFQVPTPHLQSILEYQGFPEEVCRWLYTFMGRLLYDLNDQDHWQVIPFLKGQAASGKSTLLRVCRSFYEREDVGVLSNNIERKFGLSAFWDKLLFVAPEVKSDLQLEQAEFQSIVSGEDVQINTKHEKARPVEWNVPGILAGNEVPGWRDNAGSILRRIVVFDFHRTVQDCDVDLPKKLDSEMPRIICKCNRAYLQALRTTGSSGVWTHLPQYFTNTRHELELVTNPLQNYLSSDRVRMGEDQSASLDQLQQDFNLYCNLHNLGKHKFNKDFYRGCFSRNGIEVRGKTAVGVSLSMGCDDGFSLGIKALNGDDL
jgi:hypothetical protein